MSAENWIEIRRPNIFRGHLHAPRLRGRSPASTRTRESRDAVEPTGKKRREYQNQTDYDASCHLSRFPGRSMPLSLQLQARAHAGKGSKVIAMGMIAASLRLCKRRRRAMAQSLALARGTRPKLAEPRLIWLTPVQFWLQSAEFGRVRLAGAWKSVSNFDQLVYEQERRT